MASISNAPRTTELKRAGERLAFHALLLENLHDAIVATDERLVLTAWNRAAEEMYGFTAQEVIGRNFDEVVRSELPEERRAEAFRLLAQTGRCRVEAVHHRKDGTQIHAEGNTMALTDAPGRIIGYVFAFRDITERKRTEDELRKQHEVLQTIIDGIPVMIRFLGPDGRVQLVNRTWETTLGWSLEEVQQHHMALFDHLYPDPQERERALAFVAAATGEWEDFRVRVRDGRTIDATFANIRLSDGTNLSIGQDITERKRTERQLRDTAEQLRALSARIQLVKEDEGIRIAREIHDELGGALTRLRWDLSALKKDLSEPADPARMQSALEKTAAMLTLTDATIDVVRRIASELRPDVLDNLGLAEAIEWQCRQFQARSGLACRYECALESTDLGRDQATAVFRIFQEALTNILRHAQATQVDISLKEEDGNVVLTIRDDGRGFAEEEISRSHALGLLGMRERAHVVGGQVVITGTKGRGTAVTVIVPPQGRAIP